MKRYFKIISGLAVFFLLALGTALAILHHIYPPARIQAMVLAKLQAESHREFRLSHAAIGLRGLYLDGLQVSEEPNFREGTLLQAQNIRVRPRLLALLRRKIELSEIAIYGLQCTVIHRADGSWNFQHASGAAKAPAILRRRRRARRQAFSEPPDPPAHSASGNPGAGNIPTGWDIDRVTLENGIVHYLDNVGHAAYALKNISISTEHLRPKGNFPLELSSDYEGQGLLGHINLHGTANLANFNPSEMSAQWDSLTLRHQGLTLESSGQIKNLKSPQLSVKASLPKQNLTQAHASQWPRWLPLLIPLQVEVDLSKKGNLINLRDASIIWNSLRANIQGQAQLKQSASPDIHFQIKTGDFSLADMGNIIPNENIHPKGTANIDLQISGPANAPALSGQASLKEGACTYRGQNFGGIGISMKFTPALISGQSQGLWNQGNFNITINARNYNTAPDIKVYANISELDLDSFSKISTVAPAGPAVRTRPPKSEEAEPQEAQESASEPQKTKAQQGVHTMGQITIGKITHPNFSAAQSTFNWDLQNANTPSRITGRSTFTIGQGRLDDVQKLAAGQNNVVKAILLPIAMLQKATTLVHVPFLPSFGRVNFKSITGDYLFHNGIMTIKESHIDSNDAYVTDTGGADLGKETLNMHVSVKLLIKEMPPILINIGCTFSNPCPKVDATSTLKQPEVQKAVEQGKQMLRKFLGQ